MEGWGVGAAGALLQFLQWPERNWHSKSRRALGKQGEEA